MPTPGRRHDGGQPSALRSDLDHAARSNFLCVPLMTTSLLGWASDPDTLIRAAAGDQHRLQPLRLPNMRPKAILTASM